MIIEIMKGIVPFLAIFTVFVVAVCYSIMSMREDKFVDSWQVSYRLAYGDFELVHLTTSERIVFLIATFMLPLVMLNLLIAIMSEVYDKV
jgi:hypothetical protein